MERELKWCSAWQKRLFALAVLVLLAGCGSGIPTLRDGDGTGGNAKLFYKGEGRIGVPLWSPDGRWVVAEAVSTPKEKIILRANGELRSRLSTPCDFGTMAWLPDGRLSCLDNTTLYLYRLDTEGKAQMERTVSLDVPDTFVYATSWHPNKPWLAVLTDQAGEGLSGTLSLLDQEGHLLGGPLLLYGHRLAWSPDGKQLAVVIEHDRTQEPRADGDIQLLSIEEGNDGKITMKEEVLLKPEPPVPVDEYLTWSLSGRWLVCRYADYRSEDYLYLLATDGSGKQVKLTSSKVEGQLADPNWSPDGKRLIAQRVWDGALVTIDMEALLKKLGVEP